MKQVSIKELATKIIKDDYNNMIVIYARCRNDAKVIQTNLSTKQEEDVGLFCLYKDNIMPFDEYVLFGNNIDAKCITLSLEETDEDKIQKITDGMLEYLYGSKNPKNEIPEFFTGGTYELYEEYREKFIYCKNCVLYKDGKCLKDNKKEDVDTNNYCNQFREKFSDMELELMWMAFGDVPMNPETEEIEEDFFIWKKGTNREEIWHWFDYKYSEGVGKLMYKDLHTKYFNY